jgi:uncharacterized protein
MMHPQSNSHLIHSIAPNKIGTLGRRLGRLGGQIAFAIILGIMGAVSSVAAPLQLPALVEPASPEHHAGKIVFVELVTPDLAAAKQFYAGLFGWTFRDIQAGCSRLQPI